MIQVKDGKGFGMKRSWPDLRYYADIQVERLRRATKILSQDKPISGPRFELGTSEIRSRSVRYSTTTFGQVCSERRSNCVQEWTCFMLSTPAIHLYRPINETQLLACTHFLMQFCLQETIRIIKFTNDGYNKYISSCLCSLGTNNKREL
jgi:hypothetical protein